MRIEHINEILPAIEGRKDFVVKAKDKYRVIDYVYQDKDTFDDPRRIECRGIKFDYDGRVLARPFQKFFNIGEKQQAHEIDFSRWHLIMKKLDGSMIHSALLDEELVFMTRMGVTDVAKMAMDSFAHVTKYKEFMRMWMRENYTPIFEYTGPENRIVIRYDRIELTLLAIRHNLTGKYVDTKTMLKSARAYDIPVVHCWESLSTDIDKFLSYTRSLEDDEGRVIRFGDGHMLKVKADDYVMKHRALDDMGSKKKVLAVVLDAAEDDLMPILDEADRKDLKQFATAVNLQIMNASSDVVRVVTGAKHHHTTTRKQFATEIAPKFPDWIKAALFKHWDGENPIPFLKDALRRNPENVQAKWRGV